MLKLWDDIKAVLIGATGPVVLSIIVLFIIPILLTWLSNVYRQIIGYGTKKTNNKKDFPQKKATYARKKGSTKAKIRSIFYYTAN